MTRTTVEVTHMRSRPCLSCGREINAASPVAEDIGRLPDPGTVTICFYCGHLMSFNVDGSFRQLTETEAAEAAADPEIIEAQRLRKLEMDPHT